MDRALMFWAANDNHIHGNQNLDQFIQQRICACWHERIATMIGGCAAFHSAKLIILASISSTHSRIQRATCRHSLHRPQEQRGNAI